MSYGSTSYGEVSYGSLPASTDGNEPTVSEALAWGDSIGTAQIFGPSLADALAIASALSEDVTSLIADGLVFPDQLSYDFGAILIETLHLRDTFLQDSILNPLLQDSVWLRDIGFAAYAELLQDALVATDTTSYVRFWTNRLRDTLQLGDSAEAAATYNYLVASALAFADLAAHPEHELLSDSIVLADTLVGATHAYLKLIDALVAGDTTSFAAVFTGTAGDSLDFSTVATAVASLLEVLQDSFEFILWDGEDQSGYVGYVMNPAVGGLTQYTNYNFNSFARIGRNSYGASSTGIYLLGGEDDAGSEIATKIKLGAFDFGNGYRSRVEHAYIGVRTDGKLILKTFTDDGKERWYETQAVHTDLNTQRGKLGRGVNSRYWQFELVNRDGEPLEVEQIEFLPVTLTRRV